MVRGGEPADVGAVAGDPELDRAPDAPSATPNDSYVVSRPVKTDAAIRGIGAPVEKPVDALVGDLSFVQKLPDVPKRFAADFQIIRDQLIDSSALDDGEKAGRSFQYFTAFARQFVVIASGQGARPGNEKDPNPDGTRGKESLPAATGWGEVVVAMGTSAKGLPPAPSEIEASRGVFLRELKDLHFESMHDAHTGQSGLEAANDLLRSASPEQLEHAAAKLQMTANAPWPPPELEPPSRETIPLENLPEQLRPEAVRPAASRELSEAAPRLAQTTARVDPHLSAERSARDFSSDVEQTGDRSTFKKLSPRMLWNVLHAYRGRGKDSRLEKDKSDKIVVAAILLLGLVIAIVIALVSL